MKMKQKSIGYPITKKVLVMTLILMSFIGMAGSVQAQDADIEVEITVTPSTLVLDSGGKWVTVHTDIAYIDVALETIKLNGVPVAKTEPDDLGNLIAKFHKSEIIGTVESGDEVTMTFTGTLKNGDTFEEMDYIRVK